MIRISKLVFSVCLVALQIFVQNVPDDQIKRVTAITPRATLDEDFAFE